MFYKGTLANLLLRPHKKNLEERLSYGNTCSKIDDNPLTVHCSELFKCKFRCLLSVQDFRVPNVISKRNDDFYDSSQTCFQDEPRLRGRVGQNVWSQACSRMTGTDSLANFTDAKITAKIKPFYAFVYSHSSFSSLILISQTFAQTHLKDSTFLFQRLKHLETRSLSILHMLVVPAQFICRFIAIQK